MKIKKLSIILLAAIFDIALWFSLLYLIIVSDLSVEWMLAMASFGGAFILVLVGISYEIITKKLNKNRHATLKIN